MQGASKQTSKKRRGKRNFSTTIKQVDETEKEILEPEIKKNRKLTEKVNNMEKEVFDAELDILTMSLADIGNYICNLDTEDGDWARKILILTGMKKKKQAAMLSTMQKGDGSFLPSAELASLVQLPEEELKSGTDTTVAVTAWLKEQEGEAGSGAGLERRQGSGWRNTSTGQVIALAC